MIRLGLLSHSPHVTGAEKMLLNLSILLKNTQEIEPILFIPLINNGPLAQEAQKNHITCVEMPYYRWYIFKPIENDDLFKNYCKNMGGTVSSFRKIILDHNLDLIINNTLTCLIGPLAAISLQIPVITWVHGILDSYLIDNYDAVYRFLIDRGVLQLSQKIICNSDWTKRYFQQYLCDEKIMTIHNWTYDPVVKKEFENSTHTFVCLNTFDHHKGMFTLIDAAKILKERNYRFTIELYGEGGEKENLIKKTELLSLGDEIQFKGRTTDVSSVYNKCLALVQPSHIEPFGMTIIEAMAHQRAVIATKSGGPAEIVQDGINGFLLEPGDANQLAEKMAYFLEEKEAAKNFGIQGQQIYLQKFTAEIAQAKFCQVINDTIGSFMRYSNDQMLVYDLLNWLHDVGGK